MISTNAWLKIICSMMINAIIFGVGIVTVLGIPQLAAQAKLLIPVLVAASFVLSPLLSIWVAPRMRLRNWGRDAWQEGDVISG